MSTIRSTSSWALVLAVGAAFAAIDAACADDATGRGTTGVGDVGPTGTTVGGAAGDGAHAPGAGGNLPAGAGGNGAGGGGRGAGGRGGAGGSGSACAIDSVVLVSGPLDIYFVWDESGSMADPSGSSTRWDEATAALESFVQAPQSAGLRVGIRFFPEDSNPWCDETNFRCSVENNADVVACSVPDVSPGSNEGAILQAIGAHQPYGGTPTFPAIAGGEAFAEEYATQHPGEEIAVVLVTDGVPNDCDAEIPGVAGSATNLTFVVGLGNGAGGVFLNAIALQGGTGSAYLIGDANAEGDLLAALSEIEERSRCTFRLQGVSLPAPFDVEHWNVAYTPEGGDPATLGYVPSADVCSPDGGWYHDGDNVVLCPATCSDVMSDPLPTIEMVYGCPTQEG